MRFTIIKYQESKKGEVLSTFPNKVLEAGNQTLVAKMNGSNVPLKEGTYIIRREDEDDIYLCSEEFLNQFLSLISK